MEVILLEKIRNLGNLGDKVNVKAGYGRNYLIPQNKAVFATSSNIERFEQRRAEIEEKARQSFIHAEQRAEKLKGTTIQIFAMASDEGKLYGSVGPTEVMDALKGKALDISKREIVMPEGPIHSIGDYVVELHLHSDVVVNLQVQILPSK